MNTNEKETVTALVQKCFDEAQKTVKSLKTLNVMVIGKTGAGKSTLVNALFGKKVAEVATGYPVTQFIRKQDIANCPLAIYDTPGLELNQQQQQELKQEVMKTIIESHSRRDVNEFIHCILYCINVSGHRVDKEELNWIRELTQENRMTKVPVIVVLTQAWNTEDAEKLKKTIEVENLHIEKVVMVLAQEIYLHIGDKVNVPVPAYGLDTLLETMRAVLAGNMDILKTLTYVQVVDLETKRRLAKVRIHEIAATFTALDAAPIPLSDMAILAIASASVLFSVPLIYGKKLSQDYIHTFCLTALGAVGVWSIPALTSLIFSSALKLLPGGSIPGAAISAPLTAAFIEILGEISILLMERHFQEENELTLSRADKELIAKQVKEELRKRQK